MKWSTPKQLILVLSVALVLRLGVAWWWNERLDGQFAFGDSGTYWALGQRIANGEPYQYGHETRIFRTPGYPILLAPIFLIAGHEPSVFWARALNAVLGTFWVLGAWWLAQRLFGRRAGMLAAVITACYPGAIATSALVLTEAPFVPLMLGHLGFWIVAWQRDSIARAVGPATLAGLFAGAAVLVRPSWMLFIPFAMAIGLAVGKPRSRHLAVGLVMLAGLTLIMTPWWIRNARVCGHFVPTTLQVGASLYDGLNPEATGASDMRYVPRITAAERADPAAAGGQPDDIFEYRLDRRMRTEALRWARGHPERVAILAGIKLARIWNLWPNEPSLSRWPVRLAVALSYVPIMLLAVLGIVKTIHKGWPYVLCWLPAVYFTLLHMIFVGSIRYRHPAMLGLIVLAAGAMDWLSSRPLQKNE